LTRWLTALGVTHNSSAAWVTLRNRAKASKVSRHWMGGMRDALVVDMVNQLGVALEISLKLNRLGTELKICPAKA
jgi:hypothetical protein